MSEEYKSILDVEWIGQAALQEYKIGIEDIEISLGGLGEKTQRVTTVMDRGWRRSLFGVQMGLFYFTMLESAMYRNEAAAIAIENAQDSYNQAVARYGAQSSQAIRAERNLERARRMLQSTNVRTAVSYVGMGLQVVSFVASMKKEWVQRLLNIGATTAHTTATAADTLATNTSSVASLKYAATTVFAKISDMLHVEVLKQKVSLISGLKYGLFAAAGALATYAILTAAFASQTAQATQEAQKFQETIGEGPRSTGLVKSFHDLSAAIETVSSPRINVSISARGSRIDDLKNAMKEAEREVIRYAYSQGF